MLAGALGALAVMTVLSAGMGWIIQVIPRVYTFYASTLLFAVVGVKLLREGLRMSPDEESEELEEVAQVCVCVFVCVRVCAVCVHVLIPRACVHVLCIHPAVCGRGRQALAGGSQDVPRRA